MLWHRETSLLPNCVTTNCGARFVVEEYHGNVELWMSEKIMFEPVRNGKFIRQEQHVKDAGLTNSFVRK